jgi:hypothetical protein
MLPHDPEKDGRITRTRDLDVQERRRKTMSQSSIPQVGGHQPVALLIIGMVSLALIWIGSLLGWWWLATCVGLALGILLRPAWLALVTAFVVSGLGWGLPLARLAAGAPVGRVALAVESVIGLTSSGGVVIILITILLGCLLGILGTWVGIAAKGLFFASKVEMAAPAATVTTEAEPRLS